VSPLTLTLPSLLSSQLHTDLDLELSELSDEDSLTIPAMFPKKTTLLMKANIPAPTIPAPVSQPATKNIMKKKTQVLDTATSQAAVPLNALTSNDTGEDGKSVLFSCPLVHTLTAIPADTTPHPVQHSAKGKAKAKEPSELVPKQSSKKQKGKSKAVTFADAPSVRVTL